MNGYEEASKINERINKLLTSNPISEDNADEWWKISRTVRSGLEIIERSAIGIIHSRTERIASEKSGTHPSKFKAVGPIR